MYVSYVCKLCTVNTSALTFGLIHGTTTVLSWGKAVFFLPIHPHRLPPDGLFLTPSFEHLILKGIGLHWSYLKVM